MTFSIKVGDRLPALRASLTDSSGHSIDLTGATVLFSMRKSGSSQPEVDEQPSSILDATGGMVEYQWAEGDTAVAGQYKAEFTVLLSGLRMSFPNDSFFSITVFAAL